jgi:hypothetical protein
LLAISCKFHRSWVCAEDITMAGMYFLIELNYFTRFPKPYEADTDDSRILWRKTLRPHKLPLFAQGHLAWIQTKFDSRALTLKC